MTTTEEYMPEYRAVTAHEVGSTLSRVVWPLAAMAAFCFIWAVYMFATPVAGGAGLLMITPENGPAGLAALLPWCSVVMGVVVAVGSWFSRESAVLGAADVILAAIMVLFGLWGIYTPSAMGSFATAYTVAGVFCAVYLALVACEIFRRGERPWIPAAVCAVAVWAVTMVGALNHGPVADAVPYACIALFIAAWGFVWGAIALSPAE